MGFCDLLELAAGFVRNVLSCTALNEPSTVIATNIKSNELDDIASFDNESVSTEEESSVYEDYLAIWKPIMEIPEEKYVQLLHRIKPGSECGLLQFLHDAEQ